MMIKYCNYIKRVLNSERPGQKEKNVALIKKKPVSFSTHGLFYCKTNSLIG